MLYNELIYLGCIAQLVEHWTFNPQVQGSNPCTPKNLVHLKDIIQLTTTLFFLGMLGLTLNRNNVIIMIMAIELMLLSSNLNFLSFSIYLDDIIGQIFVIFILTIAATESSIGLAILCTFNETRGDITFMPKLKSFKFFFFGNDGTRTRNLRRDRSTL